MPEPLTVTPVEAAAIRKFVDSLPPGLYLKCTRCNRLNLTGTGSITFTSTEYFCEGCA